MHKASVYFTQDKVQAVASLLAWLEAWEAFISPPLYTQTGKQIISVFFTLSKTNLSGTIQSSNQLQVIESKQKTKVLKSV